MNRLVPVLRVLAQLSLNVTRLILRVAGGASRSRAGMAALLATLVVLSAWTDVAPALSELLNGLAVLVVAGAGFWLIASAPFRRRR